MIKKIGRIKYRLPMINSYVIEVAESNINNLRGINGVISVHHNAQITAQCGACLDSNSAKMSDRVATDLKTLAGGMVDVTTANQDTASTMTSARDAVCASDFQYRGYTGRGVAIAILDTGVAPVDDLTSPTNRIIAFMDFVNNRSDAYDDNGHGTHVAGIAAGNGLRSDGKYVGVAPECNIVAIKTLGSKGKGNSGDVLAGIQWIIDNKDTFGIRIANLSIGTNDVGNKDPLVRAVEAAWNAGIVMVVAAGNNGPKYGSVTSPGVSRKVITVGSSDDNKKTNIWGSTRENYSGRGPTVECIVKPDVLAPGADIISCMTTTPPIERMDTGNDKRVTEYYLSMSGTSMATPIVSGAIALLLQKKPELEPDDVKLSLKKGTIDLNYPRNRQGWGLINIEKLLNE